MEIDQSKNFIKGTVKELESYLLDLCDKEEKKRRSLS